MGKFFCKCSRVISSLHSPTQEEFTVISEELLYVFAKEIDRRKLSFDGFFGLIDDMEPESLMVIDCPSCERIWLSKRWGNSYLSYVNKKMEYPFFETSYFFPSHHGLYEHSNRKALSLSERIKLFKFVCTCGYFFISANASSKQEFMLMPDILLYDVAERIEKKTISSNAFINEMYGAGKKLILCPNCGRHWICASDFKNYISYEKEDNLC